MKKLFLILVLLTFCAGCSFAEAEDAAVEEPTFYYTDTGSNINMCKPYGAVSYPKRGSCVATPCAVGQPFEETPQIQYNNEIMLKYIVKDLGISEADAQRLNITSETVHTLAIDLNDDGEEEIVGYFPNNYIYILQKTKKGYKNIGFIANCPIDRKAFRVSENATEGYRDIEFKQIGDSHPEYCSFVVQYNGKKYELSRNTTLQKKIHAMRARDFINAPGEVYIWLNDGKLYPVTKGAK